MTIPQLFYAKQAERNRPFQPFRRRKAPPRQRKFLLEPLEPRLFLSSDLVHQILPDLNDLIIKVVEDEVGVPTRQVVDSKAGTVVESQTLADTSGVVITGSDLALLQILSAGPFIVQLTHENESNGSFTSIGGRPTLTNRPKRFVSPRFLGRGIRGATVLTNRLLHHSVVLNIRGASYRLRDRLADLGPEFPQPPSRRRGRPPRPAVPEGR